MENTNILDIDYPIFIQLQNILDNPATMKSFLEVLPTDCSCENVLTSMELESKKYSMTPAKVLLTWLGSKGFGILHLRKWFQSSGLEKALVLLKNEEPLEIVVQPELEVTVNEGGEISLTCIASSYPPPEYQWFKDDVELLLHVDSNLIIKSASVNDSGQYTCLVTKWNRKANAYDWMYSNSSAVQVIPSDLHAYPSFYPERQQTMPNFMLPVVGASSSVTSDQDEVMSSLPEEDFDFQPVFNQNNQDLSPERDSIRIIRQPFVDGKISQGMSICLICEAVSTSLPVKYRWIKNGIPLPDETSSYLILSNLYPDPETGENKWKYQCEAYNEVARALSEVVVVELDEVKDTTPFVAYQKYAFMVANDTYDYLPHLRKPSADVKDLSTLLSSMGFKVLAFRNLTLTEMRNTFDFFCNVLVPGCYALFFFAGHGFDICGQTYLQPVDSSDSYLKDESVCVEYILQCLQKKKPAVNILLIDACRKLPRNLSGTLSHNHGKIYKAEMKNNTIYGYSTSFLRSSHESDNEANSVYVKHLKKYLTQNKCIQDILMTVSCEFAKDKQTSKIQFPTIKCTLAEKRKLGDPVPVQDTVTPNPYTDIVNWCDIKRSVILYTHKIARINAEIQVEFHHHKGVFCNGIDVHLFLLLEPDINTVVLHDVEINLTFTSPALHIIPANGVILTDLNLMAGERNFLFRKEILNIQKINTQDLDGNISVKYSSEEPMQNIHFAVSVSKITKLQLSINHLRSNNVEECKNYTIIKNSFK